MSGALLPTNHALRGDRQAVSSMTRVMLRACRRSPCIVLKLGAHPKPQQRWLLPVADGLMYSRQSFPTRPSSFSSSVKTSTRYWFLASLAGQSRLTRATKRRMNTSFHACFFLRCGKVRQHRTVPYRRICKNTNPPRTAPHRTAPHRTVPHRTAPYRLTLTKKKKCEKGF